VGWCVSKSDVMIPPHHPQLNKHTHKHCAMLNKTDALPSPAREIAFSPTASLSLSPRHPFFLPATPTHAALHAVGPCTTLHTLLVSCSSSLFGAATPSVSMTSFPKATTGWVALPVFRWAANILPILSSHLVASNQTHKPNLSPHQPIEKYIRLCLDLTNSHYSTLHSHYSPNPSVP
jgi:hypothetical protein